MKASNEKDRLKPNFLDYERPGQTASGQSVLGKTASVATGCAIVIFAVLGSFVLIAAALSGGEGGFQIWLVSFIFFALTAGGLFATARLSETGKRRTESIPVAMSPGGQADKGLKGIEME